MASGLQVSDDSTVTVTKPLLGVAQSRGDYARLLLLGVLLHQVVPATGFILPI